MMHLPTLTHDVVLIGGGHTHALALRMWAMRPRDDVRLTLINPSHSAAYSGMLPGFVAGHYQRSDLEIDLNRLSRAANARLVIGKVDAIDRDKREIHLNGRPPIGYDLASIDIGITNKVPDFSPHVTPVKPLGAFSHDWERFKQSGQSDIAVIGAGIAGAEIAMAMAHARPDLSIHLIDRSAALGELSTSGQREIRAALSRYNIKLHEHSPIDEITQDHILCADGQIIKCGFKVLCASPRAQKWPQASGLDCSQGFINITPQLQTSDPNIFATGDCAEMTFAPRPKAGVYAVRQAPVLFHNLRAAIDNRKLRAYHPQKTYLKLVSLGEKTALAQRGKTAFAAPLLWRWKDSIDRKFMDKLQNMPLKSMQPKGIKNDAQNLCGGCGSKIGMDSLKTALSQLPKPHDPAILSGPGDDAAVMNSGNGDQQVLTTDHLRAFTNDLHTMTRIAAEHALGDLWAMGAKPQTAMVQLILPRMERPLQERSLTEIMAAAQSVLGNAGASIIGGHSSMGAELTIGFSLTGITQRPITINGAQAGDVLILTKPIGSGTILAADMAMKAAGDIVQNCHNWLMKSQKSASQTLKNAHAMTDITGFGLAGHLAAICQDSQTGAQIDLANVPLMDGALALSRDGIRSTIWADNRRSLSHVKSPDCARSALMFDPQTSGGLLAAVAPKDAEMILHELGDRAWRIGEITSNPEITFI